MGKGKDGSWMEDIVSARAFRWTEMISYTLVFGGIRRIGLVSVLYAIMPRIWRDVLAQI